MGVFRTVAEAISGKMANIPHGIQQLEDRLREHTTAEEFGSLEDEAMAAGRVIDAIKALPMGDWDSLCTILKKGLNNVTNE